ncbi:hypothetical protein GCWU000282_03006 [Catonella morbi ATCC 51271]|uniref:Phosphodiester glycosidase domain-containing protein n=1 Tax=Catonella morbi ATCC 51271 TaxID=592026 RepID=V2Y1E0_9FIRM|nr:phosphodiester glycosidase family protein [Catonella morbi]ESL01887.1 hypothetical protein GCWU000282_03006 [Catonella morbi ATCC 51271]
MHNKKLLKKPLAVCLATGLLTASLDSYVLLKTFVISEVQAVVVKNTGSDIVQAAENTGTANTSSNTTANDTENTGTTTTVENGSTNNSAVTATESSESERTVTDSSYKDSNVDINITTVRKNNTTVYVADIKLSDSSYLKTALAYDSFGTNVTETTSSMATNNNAILAVNGDYYGADRSGYVIKNGVIYRNTVRSDSEYPDLAVYKDGSFKIIYETEVTAEELLADGVVNLFAFGPSLVENGEISVDQNTEVRQAMTKNPRTAIGIVDKNHYILVVSDGRTSESEGLSLYELAEVLKEYGATTAYNLDGGGSSTMYFNGNIVNNPTTNGHRISEREVSDIVYIGY